MGDGQNKVLRRNKMTLWKEDLSEVGHQMRMGNRWMNERQPFTKLIGPKSTWLSATRIYTPNSKENGPSLLQELNTQPSVLFTFETRMRESFL